MNDGISKNGWWAFAGMTDWGPGPGARGLSRLDSCFRRNDGRGCAAGREDWTDSLSWKQYCGRAPETGIGYRPCYSFGVLETLKPNPRKESDEITNNTTNEDYAQGTLLKAPQSPGQVLSVSTSGMLQTAAVIQPPGVFADLLHNGAQVVGTGTERSSDEKHGQPPGQLPPD